MMEYSRLLPSLSSHSRSEAPLVLGVVALGHRRCSHPLSSTTQQDSALTKETHNHCLAKTGQLARSRRSGFLKGTPCSTTSRRKQSD
ncbi:hypothetical protein T440DRAFT_168634 [Plenodomus tracheiphilus IPT5]|uniref:Uncharacterized protein n=1 Tax=Plenodomus tracheiphilus IPT5 TaxID=1408161 RepID=A0A6A7B2I7_9PLEO|nr:hypothetical protein T440DRAFT_168634 [Plenodomus tracheiphilus IPT5]